jgi:cytochrome c553
MKKNLSYLVAVLMGCTAPAVVAGGDATAGKEKAQLCFACHGEDGNSTNAIYPKLRGQYADYMVFAMQAYKDGRRQNEVMKPMMAPLSEADMKDIAAYYSRLPDGLKTIK